MEVEAEAFAPRQPSLPEQLDEHNYLRASMSYVNKKF
jgi:hypothetical protein